MVPAKIWMPKINGLIQNNDLAFIMMINRNMINPRVLRKFNNHLFVYKQLILEILVKLLKIIVVFVEEDQLKAHNVSFIMKIMMIMNIFYNVFRMKVNQ